MWNALLGRLRANVFPFVSYPVPVCLRPAWSEVGFPATPPTPRCAYHPVHPCLQAAEAEDPAALERKRLAELDKWKVQQEAAGASEVNPNFAVSPLRLPPTAATHTFSIAKVAERACPSSHARGQAGLRRIGAVRCTVHLCPLFMTCESALDSARSCPSA